MKDKYRDYLGAITNYSILGCGSSAIVHLCEYNEATFAYKEYRSEEYVKFIKDKIKRLATFYSPNEFVFPYTFIYKRPEDELFKGYVMSELYKYDEIEYLDNLSNEQKISLLKRAREILDKFHNDYNLIHTDITTKNFVYNAKYDDLKLIDFDSNIDLEKKDVIDLRKYNIYADHYIKHVGVDRDVDIFLFNLTVYSILNNVGFYNCLEAILNDEYGIFEENEKIKNIFASYKDLDCKKSLKKEYVIDCM